MSTTNNISAAATTTSTTATRSNEFLQSLPLATAGTIGLCCSVYVSQIILDINVYSRFTMCPRLVLYLHEYYRIVTSCFCHGSLLHIGMNMLSTAAIGAMVERRLGTLLFSITILWAVLLTGIFYLILAVAALQVLGNNDLMMSHALGFSGIIFHLLVLESNMTTTQQQQQQQQQRSVLGLVSVPSYAYPVVMLVVMQFLMPNISFTGHLCGILTGTLHLYGILDIIMVKESYLHEMEQYRFLRFLTSKENFVPTPIHHLNNTTNDNHHHSFARRDPAALVRSIKRSCQVGLSVVGRITESIHVAVLGRGRRANANIYLGSRWSNPWASNNNNINTTTTTDNAGAVSIDDKDSQQYDVPQSQIV